MTKREPDMPACRARLRSSLFVRLLLAATLLANCTPWLLYRLGPGRIAWSPAYSPNSLITASGPQADPMSMVFSPHFNMVSLTAAQVSLFAIWVGIGGKPLPWRLAYLVACVGLLTRMHLTESRDVYWEAAKQLFFSYFIAQAFLVAGAFLLARWLGVGLRVATTYGGLDESSTPTTKTQFTLRDALWWFVGFAVLLGISAKITNVEDWQVWPSWWWWAAKSLLPRLAVAVAAFWMVLGSRWPVVRIAMFLLAILAQSSVGMTGAAWGIKAPGPYNYLFYWSIQEIPRGVFYVVPQALWIAGSLLVIRVAGGQLAWRGRVKL